MSSVTPQPGPVRVFNPIGFDPPPGLDAQQADGTRVLMHKVYCRGITGPKDPDGYVNLMATLMRQAFPSKTIYTKCKGALLDREDLVCDGIYSVGSKALGYKLGPKWAGTRQHRVPIADRALARKLITSRAEWTQAAAGVPRYLLGWLRALEIDADAALSWLPSQPIFEPSDETSVLLIRDREIFFHLCDFGRVHSNLTNLRKALRGFLHYRGQPLVNLDVRNSQPLVLGILLRREFGATPPEDVTRYIDLCEAGRFYESVGQGEIPEEERTRFKQRFFGHVLFCKTFPETEAAKLFGRLFPNVYAFIRARKAADYATLAHDLQRAESGVMIGGVAGRCMRELPRTFLATIHDSAVTTADQAEAVRGIMMDEFARVGLTPTIRPEPLNQPIC